jgi:hypothetical protein
MGVEATARYQCRQCRAFFDSPEDTKKAPAESIPPAESWDVSDAELIGTVRSRSD